MPTKFKTPIRCPECGSTSVRKRDVVYKSGTSHYSGRSSTRGISFGLSGKLRPRAWLGGGSSSGKRQSIKAQEAERFPFWPSIVITGLVYLSNAESETYSGWAWFWIALSGLLFLVAFFDFFSYHKEWLCGTCGAQFVPEIEDDLSHNEKGKQEYKSTKEEYRVTENNHNSSAPGKNCSICGKWFQHSEFAYGNREDRSYCQKCNSEEKTAYSQGGKEAARQYREEMRSEWQKA